MYDYDPRHRLRPVPPPEPEDPAITAAKERGAWGWVTFIVLTGAFLAWAAWQVAGGGPLVTLPVWRAVLLALGALSAGACLGAVLMAIVGASREWRG